MHPRRKGNNYRESISIRKFVALHTIKEELKKLQDMETLTVTKTGQYFQALTFTGTKKQVISHLRDEARRMRRESRTSRHLKDSVHAINENLHTSKLVTMASFQLNNLGLESILELINNHGVIKYTVT